MHKFGLLFLSLFVFVNVQAQKTQSYQPKSMLYTRALELFDKEKYNAAIEVFKDFQKETTDKMMLADANFYIAACKLKLTHSNAERQMLDFIDDYPYSSKLNLAYYLMADYYFDKRKYRRSIRYFKEVEVNGEKNPDAAWFYPEASHAAKSIEGYVAFWKGVEVVE